MKTGHVNLKTVAPVGLRFDASYHMSDGVETRRMVDNSPYGCYKTHEIADDIFIGPRARRYYVSNPDHGIPFLSSSDILLADLDNLKLASKKYMPVGEMMLQKGWTLITRSGTIGNCAFANAKHAQKLASEDVIRLKPNNILRAGVIYAFFACKYGHSLLTQGTFGGVIQHIEPPFVGSLPIPKFPEEFQKEVDGLVQESARLREEAADALDKAVAYFDSIYSINPEKTKTFSKKVNNLSMGGLFAAYNNNLEVDEFISQYENNSVTIKELTTKVFAPPLFKHIYLSIDNGHPFMTGSELTQFNLRYYRWLSPRGVKDIKDYVVHEGDLLLYKSGTTDGGILGNVFIADRKLDGCCLSDHVIRMFFREKPMAYWTFAFLKSKGAKEMLKRLATGSMIPFITPERLCELQIPTPDGKFEEIVGLIAKYISLNSKSKQLEEKASQMVEDEIEKWNK